MANRVRLSAIMTESGPASVVTGPHGDRVDPARAEALLAALGPAAAGPPAGDDAPDRPMAPVVDRSLTERVDREVELAAAVGRPMRDLPREEPLGYVLGFTITSDVSARDVQFPDGRWVRGKSFDTFCPVGPAVVSADELADPQRLRLTTAVNGELVQDSTTAEMVFGIAEPLAFCSGSFTLLPGDLVLTGTPWGCGEFMDPPRSPRDGDVVACAVEGIGSLRNTVRDR